MVDIAAVTSSTGGIANAVKEVVSIAERVGNRELTERAGDLLVRILDIQTKMAELANENHALKLRISELEQAGELAGKLVYQESVYWLLIEGVSDGPFCPKCWDAEKKLIRLTPGECKGTFSCSVGNHGGFRTSECYDEPLIAMASGNPLFPAKEIL
jgi:hypothetical protein